MTRDGEEGYALVAAVASIAVFAAMALTVLSAARTAIADAGVEQAELQASAAADAGLAIALSRLLSDNLIGQWRMDGRDHRLHYGNAELLVRIEDERGKVPINGLDEKLLTRLLEEAGLDGDRLLVARDALLDWMDDDQFARPFGAEAPYYQAAGIRPPDGSLSSIGELRSVRGFDATSVARIGSIATTYGTASSFDPRFASPRALAIMEDADGQSGVSTIDHKRERSGQRTALAFADTPDLRGRPVTILVKATLDDGTNLVRRTLIQLGGRRSLDGPYAILASD